MRCAGAVSRLRAQHLARPCPQNDAPSVLRHAVVGCVEEPPADKGEASAKLREDDPLKIAPGARLLRRLVEENALPVAGGAPGSVLHEAPHILTDEPARLKPVDSVDSPGPAVPRVLCAQACACRAPCLTRERRPEDVAGRPSDPLDSVQAPNVSLDDRAQVSSAQRRAGVRVPFAQSRVFKPCCLQSQRGTARPCEELEAPHRSPMSCNTLRSSSTSGASRFGAS
jgi:hypothetical protein